jgi:enoyl-CoA hydratase/carnithine racemase
VKLNQEGSYALKEINVPIMKLKIKKNSPAYWRVILDNPPLNLFDPELSNELMVVMADLEQNAELKVVVFESAVPDFFMAHVDLVRAGELDVTPRPPFGLTPWPDVSVRLENAPFVTVGLIRGRARGVGSEFIQALDVRFASREKAVFAQLEIGTGLFPGAGGMERLPLMVGRARALEIMLSSEDYDADTAEKYGWINRSIPDADLDAFVERFARRVENFSKEAIATTKELINTRIRMAEPKDIIASGQRFFGLLSKPVSQAHIGGLMKKGLQTPEFELNIGEHFNP